MTKIIGFLKLSQKFQRNVENGKYFPILDKLNEVAAKNHDSLPYSFSIKNLYGLTDVDVTFVLSELYPNRKYYCKKVDDDIFCVRT